MAYRSAPLYEDVIWRTHLQPQDAGLAQAVRATIAEHREHLLEFIRLDEPAPLNAMTLAQCTPVIALDEPAAHLDAVSRFALADLITGLCRATGKTILTVMHDLPEVLRLADHIAVLHEGHVVFEGTPQEFLQQEIHRRVYRLEINGSVETGYAVLPYSKNPSA